METKYIIECNRAYQPYKMGERIGLTKEQADRWVEHEMGRLVSIVEVERVADPEDPSSYRMVVQEIWNPKMGKRGKEKKFIDPLAVIEEPVEEEKPLPKRRGRPRKKSSLPAVSDSGGEV